MNIHLNNYASQVQVSSIDPPSTRNKLCSSVSSEQIVQFV